ncbi:uncharacterized protein TRAVEDRAFT_131410, partial [Trametes versicolor FP-101664 SS1]|uniref:uncharacterized protein n=1 Tax=Trametes versicolor (strain FP-101664) TaxID=717944 RepID=UPI0004621339
FVVSSAVWLLYDLLTTFDQEVSATGCRSANTLPKFLYLVSRYVGIFGQFCNGQLITSLILDSCLILSVELSLMLRIDALYGRKAKRVWLLNLPQTAAAINGIIYPRIYAESRPFPSDWPLKGCFFPTDIFWNKLCWYGPDSSGIALLFCLNTAKCISYGRLEQTPLIYRLFRDGSAYFAMYVPPLAEGERTADPSLLARSVSMMLGAIDVHADMVAASFHARLHRNSVSGRQLGLNRDFYVRRIFLEHAWDHY